MVSIGPFWIVHKAEITGTGSSYGLRKVTLVLALLHPHNPRCVQGDFARWTRYNGTRAHTPKALLPPMYQVTCNFFLVSVSFRQRHSSRRDECTN